QGLPESPERYSGLTKTSTALPRLSSKRTIL
ncbi:AzlC family protein, partial [Neisseria meningitidis]